MYNSLSNPDSKSGSNKVISPYSLLSVLTLAMLGTKGITKNQIRDALYLPCDDEANYYEAYSTTMNSLFNYQLSLILFFKNCQVRSSTLLFLKLPGADNELVG